MRMKTPSCPALEPVRALDGMTDLVSWRTVTMHLGETRTTLFLDLARPICLASFLGLDWSRLQAGAAIINDRTVSDTKKTRLSAATNPNIGDEDLEDLEEGAVAVEVEAMVVDREITIGVETLVVEVTVVEVVAAGEDEAAVDGVLADPDTNYRVTFTFDILSARMFRSRRRIVHGNTRA